MGRRSDRSDHPVVIDFIVRGTPKSQGARFRGQWQDEVRRGVPAQLPLLAPPIFVYIRIAEARNLLEFQ